MKNHSSKRLAVLSAAVAALGLYGVSGAVAPVSAADTGFNQTDAGPYDYNNPANWVGGVINGIWDPSLVLTDSQTVTFGTDTTLGSGLSFLYDGSKTNLTLRSDGTADRTLTLGGDILVNTVSASRTITIGSGTANQKLNVDLGGATRTFDVRGTADKDSVRSLTFANPITNGSLVLQGGGNVNFSPSAITSYSLSNLTLKNVVLNASNNKTSVNVAGALTFDGVGGLNGSGNTGGIGILSLGSGATVSAGSLARVNNAVALFRGSNLGGGSTSINFDVAPTLLGGGGAAGSTNISIIPWALGGTSTSSADTFVTYDATNGIRPLDPTTEFANYADGFSGSVTGTDNNVKVADGATVEFTGNNTVNSLSVNYNSSAGHPTTINGGTITVTSGAVSLVARQGATLNADLNFGSAQGVIGYIQGKGTTITGAISGSGGLVLYQQQPHAAPSSAGSGVTMSGNAAKSTYTGDTYILSRVNDAIDGFLPSGSRSGDVYVNGVLSTKGFTINGLNGSGSLSKAFSGTGTVTLGDNDANGNFGGVISGQLNLIKIGGGTQVLGGTSTYSGDTTVSAGTLIVNGSIASSSGVNVSDGATLGGSGDVGNLTMADGGHLAPGNSPGTLHTLSLLLNDASSLDFELGTLAGPNDRIDITGDLTLDGILNLTNLGGLQGGQYTLMTYTGGLTDHELILGNVPGGFNYSIDTGTTGKVLLDVSAVPEPGTMALLGFGGLLLSVRHGRPAAIGG